jgi:hypothetical protein
VHWDLPHAEEAEDVVDAVDTKGGKGERGKERESKGYEEVATAQHGRVYILQKWRHPFNRRASGKERDAPVGVEILIHVTKAAFPPPAPIPVHLGPIVWRETPVLLWITGSTCHHCSRD